MFDNAVQLWEDQLHPDDSSIVQVRPALDASGHYLPPAEQPTEPSWRGGDGGLFSAVGSNAQRLPAGGTLVCETDAGRLIEFDANGQRAWELDLAPCQAFRAWRYAPDHPALQGRSLVAEERP